MIQKLKVLYKNPKFRALFVIAVLLILSVYWFFYSEPSKKAPQTNTVNMHEENLTDTDLDIGNLNLVFTDPPAGKIETIFTGTAVRFVFDSEISLYTASITIKPAIEYVTDLGMDSNMTLIVRPKDSWKLNTPYTVTVNPGLRSRDGEKMLKNAITHTVEFLPITNIISD